VLPQSASGAVDVDKQVKMEQMVLSIHDAYKAGIKSYDKLAATFKPTQVKKKKSHFYVCLLVCFNLVTSFTYVGDDLE
jgi:hypothetical protein